MKELQIKSESGNQDCEEIILAIVYRLERCNIYQLDIILSFSKGLCGN